MNYLRRYNTALSGATRIPIPVRVSSGALATSSDYTPAAGDSKVSIDCGTEANTGTDLTWDDGTLYLTLSGAELSGKLICVRVIDAAIQNEAVYIETFGHASAMYPGDYADVVRMGMTALPNAAAAAAGGLPVSAAGGLNVDGLATLVAKFTGITLLAEWLGLIAGKQTGNSTARTELRATGAGSGTYDETTDSLQAVRDRGDAAWVTGSGGGGSGAYTYTVTVTSNGSTPVNGARVRLTGGAEDRLLTVGADGVAAFSVDAGSYTLSITASGYTYTPTTVAISASATATVTLTAVSIPPAADASQTTAYTTCRDGQGAAESGAVIDFRFVGKSDDDSYDRTNFSATSNGSGLLTISLPKSATMQARRRPKGDWVQFTTGTDASYELPQALSGYGS